MKIQILGNLHEDPNIGQFTWRSKYWEIYMKIQILGKLHEGPNISEYTW
jgi:uncharacterized protein (UPF0147 family)